MTTSIRSALLMLAVFATSISAAAQGTGGAEAGGTQVRQGGSAYAAAAGWMAAPAPETVLGPGRAPSFRSAPLPYTENALTDTRASGRSTTIGAVIGGVIGGVVGFAGGYTIDNIERAGGAHLGSATLVGTAGGVIVGALLGAGVGWLVGR